MRHGLAPNQEEVPESIPWPARGEIRRWGESGTHPRRQSGTVRGQSRPHRRVRPWRGPGWRGGRLGLDEPRRGWDVRRTSVGRIDGEVWVEGAEATEGVKDEVGGVVAKVFCHSCGFVLSRDEPAVARSVAERVGRRLDPSKATTLSIHAIRL